MSAMREKAPGSNPMGLRLTGGCDTPVCQNSQGTRTPESPAVCALKGDCVDDAEVSMFRNAFSTEPVTVEVQAVLTGIKSGRWSEQIKQVRKARQVNNEERKRQLKTQLPAVAFSGTFTERNSKKLVAHSRIVCLDLDHLENINDVRPIIDGDPHTMVSFKSPSGDGLKVLVRVEPLPIDEQDHKLAFDAAKKYYGREVDLKIDPSGKDVARLCFVSYDPDIYLNKSPVPVSWHLNDNAAVVVAAGEVDRLEPAPFTVTSALQSVDPDESYEDWLNVGMALHSWSSDLGLELWIEWSAGGRKYKPGECRSKWISFASSGGITINTLLAKARSNGWIDGIILPGGLQEIRKTARHVYALMAESGNYFYRRGVAVELINKEISVIVPSGLQSRIEEFGTTLAYTMINGQSVLRVKRVPESTARALLAAKDVSILPPLEMVLRAPMLFRLDNGDIVIARSGYCRDAEVYVIGEHQEIHIEADDAADLILDLLRDFNFVDPADRSRALAMIVTCALRLGGFIRDGRCPLLIVEADTSQAGKGYLLAVIAAIYDEVPSLVAMRTGGVGGFDESIQDRLVKGHPFIQFDNLRGRIDSQYIEALLTATGTIGCRIPHRGEIHVDPRHRVFMATSNGLVSTVDLANRGCFTRIRKQSESYTFHRWPDGGLLEHVRANRATLLAGVHAIVTAWHEAGEPRADVTGHDFRDWRQSVQAIVSMFWPNEAPVVDAAHQEAQQRISNPGRSFLRELTVQMHEPCTMQASEVAELADDYDISIPGAADSVDTSTRAKAVGKIMARLFRAADTITVENVTVTRRVRKIQRGDGKGLREIKEYTFDPGGSPPETLPPTVPPESTTSSANTFLQRVAPSGGSGGTPSSAGSEATNDCMNTTTVASLRPCQKNATERCSVDEQTQKMTDVLLATMQRVRDERSLSVCGI